MEESKILLESFGTMFLKVDAYQKNMQSARSAEFACVCVCVCVCAKTAAKRSGNLSIV